ncbi:HAD hydrolase-like protein [Streptomyces durbertensis]|uniref:HAD hydrolase-like protein n=2 Tax=Streptomyces durbertensis TaxID=2448886 RepID=A0ABR6EE18_9ACTN|nr:HAD hydrolase-like protein [Streptomyces durbertensis]
MAGTTVADDGLVEAAFRAALPDHTPDQLAYVRATMGESKIKVFRHLLAGDEPRAQHANTAFEHAYADLVDQGACTEVPGARETIKRLRADGRAVVLTTGFARATQDRLLHALGWEDLADLTLCPADAGRGRPHPDLPLTALLRTRAAADVRQLAVCGDTVSDVRSGLAAGAGLVAGVLTGAHTEPDLRAAGAHHVLPSVTGLPALLDPL